MNKNGATRRHMESRRHLWGISSFVFIRTMWLPLIVISFSVGASSNSTVVDIALIANGNSTLEENSSLPTSISSIQKSPISNGNSSTQESPMSNGNSSIQESPISNGNSSIQESPISNDKTSTICDNTTHSNGNTSHMKDTASMLGDQETISKCPNTTVEAYSRSLLQGQWVAVAYSQTQICKWTALISRVPNHTMTPESCITVDFNINEDADQVVQFDIMNNRTGLIHYGFRISRGLETHYKWEWDANYETVVTIVYAAERVTEDDLTYSWMILVDCDQHQVYVKGWALYVNHHYYHTEFYQKNKQFFSEKLGEIPGLNFEDRVEPSPSSSCNSTWAKKCDSEEKST